MLEGGLVNNSLLAPYSADEALFDIRDIKIMTYAW